MQLNSATRVLGAAVLASLAVSAHAAVSLTNASSTYTQNFDSLPATGTAITWTNDSTILGWDLFNGTGAAITSIIADSGSSTTGSFFSYGSSGSTERALGGLGSGGTYFGSPASGAVAGYIAFAATNNTGSTLSSFTVKFDGEEWRNGGNTTAQKMVLQYGFGSAFSGVTWTAPGNNFDWTSPVATATAAAVIGNVAGLVANRGGTISNLTWTQGQTLWIRWIENNDVGNDHGLAIDNFSLAVTAVTPVVPEPGTYAMLLAGVAAVGFVARRRA